MRAISIFIFEDGRSRRACLARVAFRIRVNKSAMGSVVILFLTFFLFFSAGLNPETSEQAPAKLPAGLYHARDFSRERVAAETNAAHFELAYIAARASADPASIPHARLELRLAPHFCKLTVSSHALYFSLRPALGPKRHTEQLYQLAAFFVRAGRRRNRDVHALNLVHARVIDFREHELVLDAQGVIAAAVKRVWRQALEVAHTRQNDGGEAVEEFVHPLAPQRDHAADGHALANLEIRDRLLRARDDGLLSRDLAKFLRRR